jgi:hypothetical protein
LQPTTVSRAIVLLADVRFQNVKNGVFWDVTPCGSCKNRRFGGTWCLFHQGDKNWWIRNNASVALSSPILVTLMMEKQSSPEMSVRTRATQRNIPEVAILHSHRRENLNCYTMKILEII